MKAPKIHKLEAGFALVITLSLMILLVVVAVGLLTLSSISLRSNSSQDAIATARANARMAMILAIGQLQKQAGPDQNITLTANINVAGKSPAKSNIAWTGTSDVSTVDPTTPSKNANVSWLVSGENPNPATAYTLSTEWNKGNALALGSFGKTTPETLLSPVVNLTLGTKRARLAWWIGDEGTKARVDIEAPKQISSFEREKIARAQSPQEAGLVNLGSDWKSFAADGSINKTALISLDTASIASANPDFTAEYFNDLTTGGHGVPSSLLTGGMKADLSLIFDKSQRTKPYASQYFGSATPTLTSFNNAAINTFTSISDQKKFYLSDSISNNGATKAGPNWGNIWNYAILWQNVAAQQATLVGPNPMVETDVRYKDWLPNTASNLGGYRRDISHTNSPLTPVISMLQLGFRLSSERVPKVPPATTDSFKAQITMQPVIGIWNPYNVKIKALGYRFDWALYPYFRFNYARPTGGGKYTDSRLTELWLRNEWAKDGLIPTPEDPLASNFFSVDTDPVDLQPGEFRLFSVIDKTYVAPGKRYRLKSGWSENGGFIVNLKKSDGSEQIVPSGHRAWFGAIFLQDTQSSFTTARFPKLDSTKVASTWYSLKAEGGSESILSRTVETWNGDNKTGVLVPEPVVSGSSGGLDTTKTTYLIDDLEGDKVLAHIATWSFITRTTQQVEETNQQLRGWIDSNPRALVSNSSWDGSKVSSTGDRTGWHTISQMVGVYNPPGKPKQVGDGKGGNRGLLAEGGSEVFEPEVNKAGGRYQGFGGAANTNAGKNNVIIYDVPRSPLVSLGQLQHAQLSRYNFDPGFVVGNSYANPRIPLNSIVNNNFSGVSNLKIADISYEVNRRLWDSFFFSSVGIDHKANSGSVFNTHFNLNKLAAGEEQLPNPRMQLVPLPGDVTIDKMIQENSNRAPEALAARIMVKGAFNVNSTSKTAWKATLSSMGASQLPVINPSSNAASWENPAGIRFNRFGHVIHKTPYQAGNDSDDPAFWQGYRDLSNSELDALAEEIVKEVQDRGPFRSLAEFVNRNPYSNKVEHQQKGPLQAAIDRAINSQLPASVGAPASQPTGSQFSNASAGESQAAGNASYLLQGDVLQSLGPILQARSDYFKIRTSGEAVDASGKVLARAWCEAHVQRTSQYIDPKDKSHFSTTELTSNANKKFGRSFKITSFRWLTAKEIQA
jgi:hypothetical protein